LVTTDFQQTGANHNLQVYHDKQQISLIGHVVNRSFMRSLSRFGWCHEGFWKSKDPLQAVL